MTLSCLREMSYDCHNLKNKREYAHGQKSYLPKRPRLWGLLVNFVVDSKEKNGFYLEFLSSLIIPLTSLSLSHTYTHTVISPALPKYYEQT